MLNISCLFAVVRSCSKTGYIVDDFMTLIYVITASFIIKEVDPLFLVCLSHTIPFHANGLCIVYVYAFVLAPSSEGGHLLAGNIAEVSEVAPHVDAEQVIKALQ